MENTPSMYFLLKMGIFQCIYNKVGAYVTELIGVKSPQFPIDFRRFIGVMTAPPKMGP